MQKRGQCRTSRTVSQAVSLISGCDLISANWLIGAPDTNDATIHADIRARGKGRRNGRGKKGHDGTYTRATAFHGSFSGEPLVLVLDARPLEPGSLFSSLSLFPLSPSFSLDSLLLLVFFYVFTFPLRVVANSLAPRPPF